MSIPTRPEWPPKTIFCARCEFHLATTDQPLCPVCLDDIRRERKP